MHRAFCAQILPGKVVDGAVTAVSSLEHHRVACDNCGANIKEGPCTCVLGSIMFGARCLDHRVIIISWLPSGERCATSGTLA